MQPQEAALSLLALGKRASHNFARHIPLRNFAFHKQAFHTVAVVERRAVGAVDRAGRTAADTAGRRVVAVVGKAGRTAAVDMVVVNMVVVNTVGRTVVDRVVAVVGKVVAGRAGRTAAVDTVVVNTVGRTVAGNSMNIRSAVRDIVVGRTVVGRTEEDIAALDIGGHHSRKVPGDRLGNTLEPVAVPHN